MRKNLIYTIFAVMTSLLTSVFAVNSVSQAGSLSIYPSSGDLVKGCIYPFSIYMDNDNLETLAVDTKLFVNGFNLYESGNTDLDNLQFLTGVTTITSYSGDEYRYINTYQNTDHPISGNQILIWDVLLEVQTGTNNFGSLEFYFLGAGVEDEDSGIPLGKNLDLEAKPTQFDDNLLSVLNGNYNFLDYGTCWPISFIISGFYNSYTFVDSGYDAVEILDKVLAGYFFNYPTNYPGDTIRNSRTQSTGWTTWTNTAVTLIITGDLQFILDESTLSGLDITVLNNSGYSFSKTLIINENVSQIPLSWSTSGNVNNQFAYTNSGVTETGIFYMDVFWIDTELPELTGRVEYYTGSFAIYTLSGYTSGVNWSDIDDEFKILNFSGILPAPTNYLTSSLNQFALVHSLDFSSAWSGEVIYIDRAGNTGSFWLDIPPLFDYIIKAHPQSRLVTSHTPNPNLATMAQIAVYDSGFNLVITGEVETNNFGTGMLSLIEPLSGYYFATINGLSHLQSVISGAILINQTTNIFDFSDGSLTRNNGPIDDDILTMNLDYLNISVSNFADIRFEEFFLGYSMRNGLDFEDISGLGTQMIDSVERDNLNIVAGGSDSLVRTASVIDASLSGFNTIQKIKIYDGATEITNDGYFDLTTGVEITAVEIAGELLKDNEINGVDASIIIEYILNNGVINTNSEYGLVLEDLNANGQVDAADVTVLGYNLYRKGVVFP